MTTITPPYATNTVQHADRRTLRRTTVGLGQVRASGAALAAGATAWAVGLYTMGTNPSDRNAVV
jgi:hypothetical protein